MLSIKKLMCGHTVAFALLVSGIVGCTDSNDDLKKCLPAGAKRDSDSIAFVYNNDHRLTEIQYRTKTTVNKRYSISYSNNKPVRVTVLNRLSGAGTESEDERYDLTYGTNELVKSMIYSKKSGQGMEKMDSVVFSYDDKNRLIKKDNWLIYAKLNALRYHTRYEYQSTNNVAKIFYKLYSTQDAQELLGAEQLSFDSNPRFFAGSDDLKTIQVYIFNQEPSENNVISAKVFGTDAYTWYSNGTFRDYQYTLTYDDNGYVSSLFVNSVVIFYKVRYDCF